MFCIPVKNAVGAIVDSARSCTLTSDIVSPAILMNGDSAVSWKSNDVMALNLDSVDGSPAGFCPTRSFDSQEFVHLGESRIGGSVSHGYYHPIIELLVHFGSFAYVRKHQRVSLRPAIQLTSRIAYGLRDGLVGS